MLDDRDYMRQPAYHEPRVSFRVSFTVLLLILNGIIFFVECVACGYPPMFSANNFFALSVEGLKRGFVWQLLTYQFMHAGLLHLLLNGWAIYIFGRAIEEALGWKRILILFLTSGVIGGIFQALAALLWPKAFGGPVVGASAGAFGLVAAFAVLFPERELALLFLPVTFRAKTLLIVSAVLAVLGLVFPADNIANAAHLGGMLTGVVFIRRFVQGRRLPWQPPLHRTRSRESEGDLSADEFLQKEVDPILDKISAQGIQSLTAREREILEKARSRMGKR
jgi:membrane associated rhomboid family serine protease